MNHRKYRLFFYFSIGCIFSFYIHYFLFKKIRTVEIKTFDSVSSDISVPRKFHLERVDIDPNMQEESSSVQKNVDQQKIDINSLEKHDSNNSRNTVPSQNLSSLTDFQTKDLSKDLFPKKEILEKTSSPRELLVPIGSDEQKNVLNNSFNVEIENLATYSKIDDLLEDQKTLSSQTAPILLPTDLLFEYDDDQLREDADESLQKLALLIERNPKSQFIVEGFTDSFGTDEYNIDLSTRRANRIKQWLIEHEHINPHQIISYGLGKKKFLVSAQGTIKEQRLNRRVEIVIHQDNNL